MQELGNDPSRYVRGVELLFAHLNDAESAAAVKPVGASAYGRQPAAPPPDWPRQPPTLEKPEDLRPALERAVASGQPTVIDVLTDPDKPNEILMNMGALNLQ